MYKPHTRANKKKTVCASRRSCIAPELGKSRSGTNRESTSLVAAAARRVASHIPTRHPVRREPELKLNVKAENNFYVDRFCLSTSSDKVTVCAHRPAGAGERMKRNDDDDVATQSSLPVKTAPSTAKPPNKH